MQRKRRNNQTRTFGAARGGERKDLQKERCKGREIIQISGSSGRHRAEQRLPLSWDAWYNTTASRNCGGELKAVKGNTDNAQENAPLDKHFSYKSAL